MFANCLFVIIFTTLFPLASHLDFFYILLLWHNNNLNVGKFSYNIRWIYPGVTVTAREYLKSYVFMTIKNNNLIQQQPASQRVKQ